ncbi:unnamed protein product [Effrenium voratum]|nr:unnamed protein product [Effrenium voratum]
MGNQIGKLDLTVQKGTPRDAFLCETVLLALKQQDHWTAVSVISGQGCKPSVVQLPETGLSASSKCSEFEWAICGPSSEVLSMASSKHTGKEMFVDFPSGLTLRFSPSSNPLSTGQPLQEGKTLKLSVRGGSTDAESSTPAAGCGHSESQKPSAGKQPTVGEQSPRESGGPSPESGVQRDEVEEKAEHPPSTASPAVASSPALPSEPAYVREPAQGGPELSTNKLQVIRAGAAGKMAALAGAGPTLDSAGTDLDMTTMAVAEIEKKLVQGDPLPGWPGSGHPQKVEVDPETARLVKMLAEQLALMEKNGDFMKLSEQSQYDMQVTSAWCRHLGRGIVPHGPLLGWARLMGHELYYHIFSQDQPPFLMAKVPGLTYQELLSYLWQVSLHHLLVIFVQFLLTVSLFGEFVTLLLPFQSQSELRRRLMQAGLWRAPTLRIPVGMSIPSQSLVQMNTQILNTLFPDKQGLPILPDNVDLRVLSPEVQRHSPFRVISGQPPAGGDSMFFDDSTNRSWYLQGKSHYAYCMTRKPGGGQIVLDWVRRADVPGHKHFQVISVMPADAPDLHGIGRFRYHRGLYCEEGGAAKALYLELVDREFIRGKEPHFLHLFACSQVSPEMLQSVVSRAPAGQGFVPRRSKAGWVVQGNRPFHHCRHGWVWQDAYNGATTFYFELPETGTSHEFKQWAVDGLSWVWSDQDAQYVEAHPATGQWHFQSVEEWAPNFLANLADSHATAGQGQDWGEWTQS